MTNTVTKESIEAKIVREKYLVVPSTTTTICALEMENGFVQIGTSACVDPSNFDDETGRRIARSNAFDQLWALEGYLLKEALHKECCAEKPSADKEESSTPSTMISIEELSPSQFLAILLGAAAGKAA